LILHGITEIFVAFSFFIRDLRVGAGRGSNAGFRAELATMSFFFASPGEGIDFARNHEVFHRLFSVLSAPPRSPCRKRLASLNQLFFIFSR
jgi:hypothetical protein